MTYDIIDLCSIRPATSLGSPNCGRCLAVTLPRLCRPEPTFAETLAPYPLSLRDRHHHDAGAAPAVAPHPDVHLVEPAAVAPVQLRVGGGVSKTLIVLEAVWDCGVMKQGMRGRAPARLPPSRCRGRAGAGCWTSHRA
jgi:hypothetical protein